MSQSERIREWLEAGNEITSLEAIRMFGCTRLAARIADLRRDGMRIKAERRTVMTRDGRANVCVYSKEES